MGGIASFWKGQRAKGLALNPRFEVGSSQPQWSHLPLHRQLPDLGHHGDREYISSGIGPTTPPPIPIDVFNVISHFLHRRWPSKGPARVYRHLSNAITTTLLGICNRPRGCRRGRRHSEPRHVWTQCTNDRPHARQIHQGFGDLLRQNARVRIDDPGDWGNPPDPRRSVPS